MRWTIRAVIVLLAFSAAAHADHLLSGDELQRAISLSLLFDADADRTRLGAKTIGQLYADKNEMMDGVAEMLVRSVGVRQEGKAIDVVAVYAAVLGKSKNPRYRLALTSARNKKNAEKVNDEIAEALALVGKDSADHYRPGGIDPALKAVELKQMLASNREANRAAWSTLRSGTDLRRVLDVLGAPDDVSAITQMGSVGRRAMIVVHYYGQGLIAFRLERDTDAQWSAFEINAEQTSIADYRGPQPWFAHAIACMKGIQYRNLIRFYAENIQTDAALLPVLTQRLITMDDLDDYEEDATEYIPQVLARVSFPNESELWKAVKVRGQTRIVRKVAEVRLKQLRKMPGS